MATIAGKKIGPIGYGLMGSYHLFTEHIRTDKTDDISQASHGVHNHHRPPKPSTP